MNEDLTEEMREGSDGTGGSGFLRAVLETTGTKGLVLVGFLGFITVYSFVFGVASLEGVTFPVVLIASLVAGFVVEYMADISDEADPVGLMILGIAVAYTALEAGGIRQGIWFPLASSVALLGTTAYDSLTEGVEADVVDFFGNLDIVGLYSGILLLVYSLLYYGGQIEFIYTPFFLVLSFVFVASVLVTSVAYVLKTSGPAVAEAGELHQRLISVVRSLDSVEDSEDREVMAEQVRAISNVINGLRIPSDVEDSDGMISVVVPLNDPVEVYETVRYSYILEKAEEVNLTGYAVDEDDNLLLFRRGTPVKYYLSEEDGYGNDFESLVKSGKFTGNVRLYTAGYPLMDSLESVTPEVSSGEDSDEPSFSDINLSEVAEEDMSPESLVDEVEEEAEA
ncbi:MAG: hypothetical protein SV760_02635, partial [Halobacteria archaeon]|nr:hypothetical protein [Halobacteria archaeon]